MRRADERPFGVALFNPHALIAARLLDRDAGRTIATRFFSRRIERALRIRERLYPAPFYRLVHAEADGLPGLVVDRFGAVLVVQTNAAGMERLLPLVTEALCALLSPEAIVLRNDSPARSLEGLPLYSRVAHGAIDGPVTLDENGVMFQADVVGGQKTGWFYDQRDNRGFVAGLAGGARVLDLYCYGGGFAVTAAVRGAEAVLGIDRSEAALTLAEASARLNGVAERCTFRRGDVFAEAAAAGRVRRAVRHRRRRSAAFRARETRRAGGVARLSQAGAARRAADRARRVSVYRLVLAQCRRRRVRRRGAARSRRCRTRRPHPARERRRPRPPGPPRPARDRLSEGADSGAGLKPFPARLLPRRVKSAGRNDGTDCIIARSAATKRPRRRLLCSIPAPGRVAERREFGELLDLVLDHLALAIEKGGDGAAETGVGDPVRAVGRHRQIAALQFVRPLRAGLDPLQPALDREFDRLVIAAFEMQKAVFAVGAPVAAVDRVASEDVERAGDVVLAAPRHEQHDFVGHALAEHREKPPGQIGRAPFAVGRPEIEAIERVPGPLGQVRPGQHVDLDAAGQRLAPLLLDRLALS